MLLYYTGYDTEILYAREDMPFQKDDGEPLPLGNLVNTGPAKTSGGSDASLYMIPVAWSKDNCLPLHWLGRDVSAGLFQRREIVLDLFI